MLDGMWRAYWGTLEIAKIGCGKPGDSVNNVAKLCADMRLRRCVYAGGGAAADHEVAAPGVTPV